MYYRVRHCYVVCSYTMFSWMTSWSHMKSSCRRMTENSDFWKPASPVRVCTVNFTLSFSESASEMST